MLACALTRLPTTAIFHLVRSDLQVTPRRRGLYELVARGAQRWVCVSEDNRATLARAFGVAPQRISVVHNGSEVRTVAPGSREAIRSELGIAAESTLVLTTGRLGAQKDHALILRALPSLVARDRSLVFVWAGDGPLREELAAAAGDSGLQSHVRLLGRREDVPELLASADLFLLPSRDEGSPLALTEAMSAGVPAIVSDAGALREIIEDRRNGLVFARGDAEDLVRVLAWALSHREEMVVMAALARNEALRDYTATSMIDGLMALIDPAGRPAGAAV